MTIDPPTLPRHIEHKGERFQRKSEFHITLAALNGLVDAREDAVGFRRFLDSFGRELRNHSVTFGGMLPSLSLCSKGEKSKSIIARAEVFGLKEAFVSLRQYGPGPPMPYPHVTLYTRGDRNGVGVQSPLQYNERCKAVSIPNLADIIYADPRQ